MTIFAPLMPFGLPSPEPLLAYAGMAKWYGSRLWQGQTVVSDPHNAFSYIAGSGFRVPTAIGVTLMPLRHPLEAAIQARSVVGATGKPFTLGLGPGGRALQEAVLPQPYESQLTAVREYVAVVRAVLEGKPVETGEYFSSRAALMPDPSAQIEIGLGVLRRGMARLAGEIADVAVTWLTPPNYIRDVIYPALQEGAAAAGRPMPRLTAMVPVALSREERDPVALCLLGNGGHLRGPHYRDMLRKAGIETNPDDMEGSARALVEGNVFLTGDLDDVTEKFQAYRDVGVDEIVLNLAGLTQQEGHMAAVEELGTILEKVEL